MPGIALLAYPTRFAGETLNRFDYVLADALEEEAEIGDPQAFMDRLGLGSARAPVVSNLGGLGAGIRAGQQVDIGRQRTELGRPVALLKG